MLSHRQSNSGNRIRRETQVPGTRAWKKDKIVRQQSLIQIWKRILTTHGWSHLGIWEPKCTVCLFTKWLCVSQVQLAILAGTHQLQEWHFKDQRGFCLAWIAVWGEGYLSSCPHPIFRPKHPQGLIYTTSEQHVKIHSTCCSKVM